MARTWLLTGNGALYVRLRIETDRLTSATLLTDGVFIQGSPDYEITFCWQKSVPVSACAITSQISTLVSAAKTAETPDWKYPG
jgi:hypothetical protein